ncbi:MAG: methyltransferase [Chloroflexota bacterium]|nr:methyltransferase [Chloroflexota bacterium]
MQRLTSPPPSGVQQSRLIALAVALGAADIGGPLSSAEAAVIDAVAEIGPVATDTIRRTTAELFAGGDPLGEQLSGLRSPIERRAVGAFYTPPSIVEPMIRWTLERDPDRIVDAGCGSGRFALAAARLKPSLPLIAIDTDPVATLLTRAALAVVGAQAASVVQADYTTFEADVIAGRTAYVGNPPYVRHHELSRDAKVWAAAAGERLGHRVSGLAGLHALFFLATALQAKPGDVGCFVTSAEWLDVGYGSIVRKVLLNGLGAVGLDLIEPTAVAFDDAMTTAVITCFEAGVEPQEVPLRVAGDPFELGRLGQGQLVSRQALQDANRWSPLVHGRNHIQTAGLVPLGQVARVHRGVVTGANDFFVLTRARAAELGLEPWCRPAITRGAEVRSAGSVLRETSERRVVLDVPHGVDRAAHPALDRYLRSGERGPSAISARYITSRRRPWWRMGLGASPPIVASYMTRGTPAFAINPDGLVVINIAHGIYPSRPMSPDRLAALVDYLNGAAASYRGGGRTYQGGLEKFEPGEMEALLIPAAFLEA